MKLNTNQILQVKISLGKSAWPAAPASPIFSVFSHRAWQANTDLAKSFFPKNIYFSGSEVSNSPDTHSTKLQYAKPHSYNENNKNINLPKWQQTFLWIKDGQFSSHLHVPAFPYTACKFLKLSKTTAWSFICSCHNAAGSRFMTQPSPLHSSVQNFKHLLTFILKQSHEDALEKGHPYYAVRTSTLRFSTSMLHLDKKRVHLPEFFLK